MDPRNHTWLVEFLLQEFSEDPVLQLFIFVLFLSVDLVIVSGNLLIILVILSDTYLHTSMYIFLSNLFLVDIYSITTATPDKTQG